MGIRLAKTSDAEEILDLFKMLDKQTKFMLLEPGERKTTIEEQAKIIKDFETSKTKVMIVIEEQEKLVGIAMGIGNNTQRNKHVMYCVMGILNEYSGKGFGYELLKALQNWAIKSKITRMELTVMEHNERAKRLYKKFGFEIEGVKQQSIKIDGKENINELMMAKILV